MFARSSEHRPDDLSRERLADARGVADEQVLLEPLGVGAVDRAVGQGADARRDAVDDRARVDELLDDGARLAPCGPVRRRRGLPSAPAARDRLDVGDGEIAPRSGRRHGARTVAGGRIVRRLVGYAPRRCSTSSNGPVRQLVTQLYETVGYLGVAIWVAIESVIIPIPSELILPFAGFLVGEGTAIEPLTGQPWTLPLVVVAGDARAPPPAALVAYAIGYWGGRP